MSNELTDFLKAHGAQPFDSASLDEFLEAMKVTVIPMIVHDVQEREQLAAELRYAPMAQRAG